MKMLDAIDESESEEAGGSCGCGWGGREWRNKRGGGGYKYVYGQGRKAGGRQADSGQRTEIYVTCAVDNGDWSWQAGQSTALSQLAQVKAKSTDFRSTDTGGLATSLLSIGRAVFSLLHDGWRRQRPVKHYHLLARCRS